MAEVCLELDDLLLSYTGERITLAVTSCAKFQVLDSATSHLASDELLESLRSGRVWVSRGTGCCLDFKVMFDDAPLKQAWVRGLLETLGESIRDAPLWSQLPLSPTLDLADQDLQDPLSLPDFSIKLARSLPSSNSIKCNSVSAEPTDTLIPPSVPHVHLIRVDVFLSFSTADKNSMMSPKRRNVSTTSKLSIDTDERGEIHGQVLGRMIATAENSSLKQHLDELASAGRRLSKASLIFKKSALSIGKLDAEASSSWKIDIPDASSLLSNTDGRPQLLMPQSSHQCLKLKRKAVDAVLGKSHDCVSEEDWEPLMSTSRIAQRMVESSLLCIIGGRQTKSQPALKLLKPYPEMSLSEIARPLWSPGFGHNMSQRSLFLTTISSALSKSLSQNSQSPMLQSKLRRLQAQPTPNSDQLQGEVEAEDIERIRRAVQFQLFRMMQVSLYDPMAARRLLASPPGSSGGASKRTGDGSEMIFDSDTKLENMECPYDYARLFDREPRRLGFIDPGNDYNLLLLEDDTDFEDLLGSEDEDVFDSLLEADMDEISVRSQTHCSSWNDGQPQQGPFDALLLRERVGIGVQIGKNDMKWDGGEEQQGEFNDLLESELEGGNVLRQRENSDLYRRNEPRVSFEDILGDWYGDGLQQLCTDNQNMLV